MDGFFENAIEECCADVDFIAFKVVMVDQGEEDSN
jgi:hypothetical protein